MNDTTFNGFLKGLSAEEVRDLDRHHCIRRKHYKKDEFIFHSGDLIREAGLVLEGNVLIENFNHLGKKTIFFNVMPGQVFGETYALLEQPEMVDAVAGNDCVIDFLNLPLIRSDSFSASSWQPKLLRNFLDICTHKNMILSHRIICTSSSRIRDRVEIFLSGYETQFGSSEFDIPFNRQEMADLLNLDRSALSRELSRMRDEGLISFHRNHFRINR